MEVWVAGAQIAAAVATVLLALLTYLYVRATRAMVDEMRAAREGTDQPFIVAFAEMRLNLSVHMAIENIGRRPAYSVDLYRRDDQAWALPGGLAGRPISLGFLAPGVKVYRDALPSGSPAIEVPVRLEWSDQTGKRYTSEAVVEWRPAFWQAD